MSRIAAKFINWGTGSNQVNAQYMPANFTPVVYTAAQSASEGDDKVSAHLNGIDTFLKNFSPSRGILVQDDWLTGATFGQLNWQYATAGGASGSSIVTTGQDSSHFGILQLSTGTSTTGRTIASMSADTIIHGGGTELIRWYVQMPNIPDGTNPYVLTLGTGDTIVAGYPANGLYFTVDRSIHTTNWVIGSAASSTRTATTTTTPFVNGTWYRLAIQLVGGVAEYFINGVSVGTISTNIPTVAVSPYARIEKTSGTTARTALLDYFAYSNIYTAQK